MTESQSSLGAATYCNAHKKGRPMPSRLHPEDQKRVDQYLASPVHQVERRPFRVWILIALVVGSVVGLGLLSRLLAQLVAV